ncbi:MAG: transporter [Lachnospiraceae bacterium]|nr:transporter [Lachnospiraceae bacterium]
MQENKLVKPPKQKARLKDVFILQAVFILFSMSHIAIKITSEALHAFDSIFEAIFSVRFIIPFAAALFILAVYALIWQQVIKRFDLSIAYANKATTLLWSIVWGFFIFNEEINPAKIIGALIVCVGVIIMNSEAVA